eukprot:736421-Rhodomonas_salina.1
MALCEFGTEVAYAGSSRTKVCRAPTPQVPISLRVCCLSPYAYAAYLPTCMLPISLRVCLLSSYAYLATYMYVPRCLSPYAYLPTRVLRAGRYSPSVWFYQPSTGAV